MPTSKKTVVTKEPKAAKEPKIVAPETADVVVATEPVEGVAPVAKVLKPAKKQVLNGVVHINISYNNTLIAISDLGGNVIAFSSSGLLGFKGSKKSTPYAANLVAKDVIEKSKRFGLLNVRIVVKGVGPARESAIRGVAGTGMNISSIMDATPVPHNGVKSSKPRRI